MNLEDYENLYLQKVPLQLLKGGIYLAAKLTHDAFEKNSLEVINNIWPSYGHFSGLIVFGDKEQSINNFVDLVVRIAVQEHADDMHHLFSESGEFSRDLRRFVDFAEQSARLPRRRQPRQQERRVSQDDMIR